MWFRIISIGYMQGTIWIRKFGNDFRVVCPFLCIFVNHDDDFTEMAGWGYKGCPACRSGASDMYFHGNEKIPTPEEIQTLFNNLRYWFPCISVGYVCNKNHWFDKIRSVLGNYNCFLISGILIIFCFVGRYFISALDFVYCALLVFAIFNLQINLKSFLC